MIQFSLIGEILGVNASTTVPGVSYIKVLPEGNWKFDRAGEMPAAVSIKAPSALTKSLGINQRVSVKGKMIVGVHDWEMPKKFNDKEAKTKKIENPYFSADQIEPVK